MHVMMNEEYGDIVRFKGFLGRADMIICYDPKDFEHVRLFILIDLFVFSHFTIFQNNIFFRFIETKVHGPIEENLKHLNTSGKIYVLMYMATMLDFS